MFDCCWISSRRTFRIVADVAALLSVGIPILIFHVSGNPYRRGFFCDDESLRYPYLESTVKAWLLHTFGFILPLATIFITESLYSKFYPNERGSTGSFVWEIYTHVIVFLFGVGCTQLLTDIGKYTIGRLRPHFFHVCSPDVNCTDPRLQNVYVENFQCRGTDSYLLKDMRLSFPSGHSSFAAYSMVFLVMYCQARLVWTGAKGIRLVIQYFAIVLAVYTGLSRVSDYKHHWSDVLAGLALGTASAVVVVMFASDLFTRRDRSNGDAPVASPVEAVPLAEDVDVANRSYSVI